MLYEKQIVPHQHREIQMQQSKRNKEGNTRFLSMFLQTLQSVIRYETQNTSNRWGYVKDKHFEAPHGENHATEHASNRWGYIKYKHFEGPHGENHATENT